MLNLLTVPVKNTYQDINTNNDGSALQIDKEKNKKQSKSSLMIITKMMRKINN